MKMDTKAKTIIGLVEKIYIITQNNEKVVNAKIDTGATKSSIDKGLAEELGLGPIIKSKVVKSAHGNKVRPIIEVRLKLANRTMKSEFTIADRIHLKYPVLIGQNILKDGFLIDPNK